MFSKNIKSREDALSWFFSGRQRSQKSWRACSLLQFLPKAVEPRLKAPHAKHLTDSRVERFWSSRTVHCSRCRTPRTDRNRLNKTAVGTAVVVAGIAATAAEILMARCCSCCTRLQIHSAEFQSRIAIKIAQCSEISTKLQGTLLFYSLFCFYTWSPLRFRRDWRFFSIPRLILALSASTWITAWRSTSRNCRDKRVDCRLFSATLSPRVFAGHLKKTSTKKLVFIFFFKEKLSSVLTTGLVSLGIPQIKKHLALNRFLIFAHFLLFWCSL